MHRELKKLLRSATGESQKVVAIFLDVRGFSSWSAESTEAADYLKSIYNTILSSHFVDPAYFKLTGDGMMVIYTFTDEKSLRATLRSTVAKSLALVKAFPTITRGDGMVNFEVPQHLGIGLARGSATVIRSGGRTLDYTGRTLNRAARLMDFARPLGVVFDDSLGIDHLTKTTQMLFAQDRVFIRGISDTEPRQIYFVSDWTKISDHSRLPIAAPIKFATVPESTDFADLKLRGGYFMMPLERPPAHPDDATIHVFYPEAMPDGSRHPSNRYRPTFPVMIERELNRWWARVDFSAVCKSMTKDGYHDDWPVELAVEYYVRPNTGDLAGPI